MRKLEFVALIRGATSAWRFATGMPAGASLKTNPLKKRDCALPCDAHEGDGFIACRRPGQSALRP
jgi:hypothetical protein